MAATLHDPRYRTLIKRLVELRVAAGLSQTSLAERVGRPQSFIGKLETLERRLDALELFDLLAALGAPADRFAKEMAPLLARRRSSRQ